MAAVAARISGSRLGATERSSRGEAQFLDRLTDQGHRVARSFLGAGFSGETEQEARIRRVCCILSEIGNWWNHNPWTSPPPWSKISIAQETRYVGS
jgi:hypothetical protein